MLCKALSISLQQPHKRIEISHLPNGIHFTITSRDTGSYQIDVFSHTYKRKHHAYLCQLTKNYQPNTKNAK
jgi:hypothetical protein